MTITLDLSPVEQAQLTDAARQSGMEPARLAKKLVIERLPSLQIQDILMAESKSTQEKERVAVIQASQGSMAFVKGVSVDDLHRERQADKAGEEKAGALRASLGTTWPRLITASNF